MLIHPSVIVDVATLKTFPSEAQKLTLYCVNGGLVELTQHGGKGSDVRKAVADVAHKKAGVGAMQTWLEDEEPKHPLFLHQMPVLMCKRALDENADNGNRGLMHPSIILSLSKHKPFHNECQ